VSFFAPTLREREEQLHLFLCGLTVLTLGPSNSIQTEFAGASLPPIERLVGASRTNRSSLSPSIGLVHSELIREKTSELDQRVNSPGCVRVLRGRVTW
jgi:hypothetical protein